MLVVYDHTERSWALRKKKENGAGTYSVDLVEHQVPHWKESSSGSIVCLSTCQKFYKMRRLRLPRKIDKFVQYLHTYPYENPMGYIRRIYGWCRGRVLLITAYKSFDVLMKKNGMESKFVPMAIDVEKVKSHDLGRTRYDNRIIYFGNRYLDKIEIFEGLKESCKKAGYEMDWICDGHFNDKEPVSQKEAWELISLYKYGIGVGRCALEMYSLGLRVLICGAQFGGIVFDEVDYIVQEKTNFNGRVITFDRDINTCLGLLPESMVCVDKVRDIAKENHAIHSAN